MEISQESLAEFKVLYKKEFDIDLLDEEALEIAQRLIGFCSIIYRPLPEEYHIEMPVTGKSTGYLDDLNQILSTKRGMLAKEFAEDLNDIDNLRFYISATLEYSEDYLREIYKIACDTPIEQIKKSRGALFAYLLKLYKGSNPN